MANIVHIVAFNTDGVIGIKDQLPFSLPEDLKTFKSLTDGSLVAMGFNTFKSILDNHMKGKSDFLPDRKVAVVCSNNQKAKARQEVYNAQYSNVNFYSTETFSYLANRNREAIIIAGGAQLYQSYRPDIILATEVDSTVSSTTAEEDIVKYPRFESLAKDYKRLAFNNQTSASSGTNYRHALYVN